MQRIMRTRPMEQKNDSVPYIVHEGILARFERIIKRLWIIILILIFLLAGTNICWVIYESQYQNVTSTEINQSADNESDGNRFTGINTDGQTDSTSSKD